MTTPSPEAGVFSWAWHRARQQRAKFWVSAVFSAIASGIGTFLVLSAHPTAEQKILAVVLAVAAAAMLTGIGTYTWALLAAPYEQRNALRNTLSTADRPIAALKTTPVSQAHGDRLREIARRLKECFEPPFDPLDYGQDGSIWSNAFREHFPCSRPYST